MASPGDIICCYLIIVVFYPTTDTDNRATQGRRYIWYGMGNRKVIQQIRRNNRAVQVSLF